MSLLGLKKVRFTLFLKKILLVKVSLRNELGISLQRQFFLTLHSKLPALKLITEVLHRGKAKIYFAVKEMNIIYSFSKTKKKRNMHGSLHFSKKLFPNTLEKVAVEQVSKLTFYFFFLLFWLVI